MYLDQVLNTREQCYILVFTLLFLITCSFSELRQVFTIQFALLLDPFRSAKALVLVFASASITFAVAYRIYLFSFELPYEPNLLRFIKIVLIWYFVAGGKFILQIIHDGCIYTRTLEGLWKDSFISAGIIVWLITLGSLAFWAEFLFALAFVFIFALGQYYDFYCRHSELLDLQEVSKAGWLIYLAILLIDAIWFDQTYYGYQSVIEDIAWPSYLGFSYIMTFGWFETSND